MHPKRGFIFVKRRRFANDRGQIWVETVIYTLIAFSLMGLVLAFVLPKIEETQDKGVIDQSVGALQNIDSIISNLGGPGNQRTPEIGISKGKFTIDGVNDVIYFTIDSRYQYSEPGKIVNIGKVAATTKKQGDSNIVTLSLSYSGTYDITYQGMAQMGVLDKSPVPYTLVISNQGNDANSEPIINFNIQ